MPSRRSTDRTLPCGGRDVGSIPAGRILKGKSACRRFLLCLLDEECEAGFFAVCRTCANCMLLGGLVVCLVGEGEEFLRLLNILSCNEPLNFLHYGLHGGFATQIKHALPKRRAMSFFG